MPLILTLFLAAALQDGAAGAPPVAPANDQEAATQAAAAWGECLSSQFMNNAGSGGSSMEVADAVMLLCEGEQRAMTEAHERWIASSGVDARDAAEARENFTESLGEAREELAEAIREYREEMEED